MEDKVNGTGMVFHIEPVPHILALTIYRQRLTMADVVDEQWDELLWELVRPIVVGAICDNCRHAVCVMESAHEMVT